MVTITRPDFKQRFYREVPANTQEEVDWVPNAGQKLLFTRFGGNSSQAPETIVCIFWDKGGIDEELLYASHSDTVLDLPGLELTGDGVKAIKIILRNDLSQTEWLGGFWEAVRLS